MRKIRKWLAIAALVGMFAIPVVNESHAFAVNQGTDGTEIQVMEPETLEIQLGAEWVGTEFQLKTDAGLYPGKITVGEDGVLRTELGGSKTYILTCISTNSSSDITKQVPSTEEAVPNDVSASSEGVLPESGIEEMDSGEAGEEKLSQEMSETVTESAIKANGHANTVAGIPLKHLLLFSFGMVAAIGTLIAIHIVQKRREEQEDEDYDEEDE